MVCHVWSHGDRGRNGGNHGSSEKPRCASANAHLGHRENLFNYVPIQETAWSLEPGIKSEMNYRIFVCDGKPEKEKIEQAWGFYSSK